MKKFSILGSLSSDVFEPRTSTGSEVFSLLTCLDDIKFVFLSFFTVIEAIWLKICAKPPSKNEKRPLPVGVRRSKTLLLKLSITKACEAGTKRGWGELRGKNAKPFRYLRTTQTYIITTFHMLPPPQAFPRLSREHGLLKRGVGDGD